MQAFLVYIMKTQRKNFIIDRIYSFKYAVKGAIILLKTENAIKVHIFSTLILIAMGVFFKISSSEWMFQCLVMGLIVCVEALNTCVEAIADYIQPNFDKKIGILKDMSAGAVLFSALFGLVVMGFIYIPKILQYCTF